MTVRDVKSVTVCDEIVVSRLGIEGPSYSTTVVKADQSALPQIVSENAFIEVGDPNTSQTVDFDVFHAIADMKGMDQFAIWRVDASLVAIVFRSPRRGDEDAAIREHIDEICRQPVLKNDLILRGIGRYNTKDRALRLRVLGDIQDQNPATLRSANAFASEALLRLRYF